MSNRSFIADVIYGLKIEYGEPVVFGKHNWTQNQETGQKTDAPTTFMVPMCIPLPENQRLAFLKSVGIEKMGILQRGQRQFLLDVSDIPAGQSVTKSSYIDFKGKKFDVGDIEDYDYAMIITTATL